MTIIHPLHGPRTIVSQRNDGRTIVNTGRHDGYVQSAYLTHNGRTYYQRTYWDGRRSYARVYRGWDYHGVRYYGYVPAYYYHPVFYGWAYNPWPGPVYYGWGWGGAPWFGSYGYYFAPYPAYPSASLWLTDYLLAANLQAAYQAGAVEGGAETGGAPPRSYRTQESGLAFVPVLADGTKTFAQGFSAAGNFLFANGYLWLRAAATASFSFSVSPGQIETIAYGIPTGGYKNQSPAEIAINGVTDATITQGIAGWDSGETTPTQLLLWRKSFGPGDYILTVRSGGAAIVYGLWMSSSSDGSQTASEQPDSGVAQPSGEGNPNAMALTPEVKQEIAQEVQQQLAAEQAAAANPQTAPSGATLPPALDPTQTIFVVSSSLDVTADGQECGLTSGDVIDRLTDTPDANQDVLVRVRSSKKTDCSQGKKVLVSVQDLQEMHNHFREQIDSGLQTLAAKSGKGGLPKAPDSATVGGEIPAPTPDSGAAAQLQAQQRQADQTEQEVQQQGGSGQGK